MDDNKTVFARGWAKVTEAPPQRRLSRIVLYQNTLDAYKDLRDKIIAGGSDTFNYSTWREVHCGLPTQLTLF